MKCVTSDGRLEMLSSDENSMTALYIETLTPCLKHLSLTLWKTRCLVQVPSSVRHYCLICLQEASHIRKAIANTSNLNSIDPAKYDVTEPALSEKISVIERLLNQAQVSFKQVLLAISPSGPIHQFSNHFHDKFATSGNERPESSPSPALSESFQRRRGYLRNKSSEAFSRVSSRSLRRSFSTDERSRESPPDELQSLRSISVNILNLDQCAVPHCSLRRKIILEDFVSFQMVR